MGQAQVFKNLGRAWASLCGVDTAIVSCGFLTSDQSGFRALHSSATCLLKCTDDWYSGMDEGLLTGLISIDLEFC